ncbi:PK beta-barrel-protein domain-containing protein-like protein [Pleomassaria siparia CBS 279.74]|uniref:PK beta-barrel-protein domain-containing protein-like protein n=1 Tax=Pleomassaria siparia CBS 279.74 TaxID=1314801 RepID=A0A6G1KCB1_9PLEO|nr:PK beta-barrel-protein domain-containing protein-like protein [Pleomassaria siparia CBS 279.74]
MATPSVHSTHLSRTHTFSKVYTPSVNLLAGVGVQGDCHSGQTIKHQPQRASNPSLPNLRQVHLIPYELFLEPSVKIFSVQPGELGENITTWGIDLLGLSKGTYLYFGAGNDAPVVQVTGLRMPGKGIERHKKGLLEKLVVNVQGGGGGVSYKAGIMGIVMKGGKVETGDMIRVVQPKGTKTALVPV